MIVKMIHPTDPKKVAFFQIQGEFYPYREKTTTDRKAVKDNEFCLVHAADARGPSAVEVIHFPVRDAGGEVARSIVTNWTTYLLNNEGKTIERVFP